MEASNYSRPLSERPEFNYGKFIIKKDPKLRLKEVIYSDDPCVSCGGRIEKEEVYEQDVYVAGYSRRRALEESAGKTEESSMKPTSSEIPAARRENEFSSAEVGAGVHKTGGDPEVRKRVRKDKGNEKDRMRRKRQAEARSRKSAGVTKKEWNEMKKHIRGQNGLNCVQGTGRNQT